MYRNIKAGVAFRLRPFLCLGLLVRDARSLSSGRALRGPGGAPHHEFTVPHPEEHCVAGVEDESP